MAIYTLAQLRDGTGFAPGARFEEYDEYNGWKNRETWAVNLWLTNDQTTYNDVREFIKIRVNDLTGDWSYADIPAPVKAWAADAVKDFTASWLEDGCEQNIDVDESRRLAAMDIGSMWRVDWFEIAAALGEE